MRLIDADNLKIPSDAPYKASVKRVVAQQPTVEAVPVVHGEWIKTDKGVFQNANTWRVERQFSYECSLCGYHTGNQGKYFNFCPNCGCDMRTSAE